MVSHSHASRRDQVVRRARELVNQERVQFALAGQQLDTLYSEETVRVDDPDPLKPGEKYAVQETPEQVLFIRLGAALDCLRFPDQHRYDNHLDFQANASIEDRRLRARMAVLVFLAAIDPNKSEAIDESMGEIASIPFELWERKKGKEQSYFGGSDWIVWIESDWIERNEPSPGLLRKFQHAIDVAMHGSSEGARHSRVPTGDRCLLYVDAVEDEDREESSPVIPQQPVIQVVIAQDQKVEQAMSESAQIQARPEMQSKPMNIDDARKKAEAIARSQGWPVYKGKPSINGMAKRVRCSHHLISKALEESKTLRHHYDLASRQSVVNSEEDRQREIRIYEREQEMDYKRDRY